MKKGDKVREIGDTLIGTIIKIKDGRADVKFSKLKGRTCKNLCLAKYL